jgi:hypothetical protein
MNKINCFSLIIFLAFSIASFACAEDQAARWKYYSTDAGNNDHYYDTKSIVPLSNSIIRVWEKKVATDKSNEVMKAMKELAELKEINCSMREYRSHVNYYYGSEDQWKTKPTEWEPIGPETYIETLNEIVCKKKGKKFPPVKTK